MLAAIGSTAAQMPLGAVFMACDRSVPRCGGRDGSQHEADLRQRERRPSPTWRRPGSAGRDPAGGEGVQLGPAPLDPVEGDLQLDLGEAIAGAVDDRMQAGDVLDVVDADRAGPSSETSNHGAVTRTRS